MPCLELYQTRRHPKVLLNGSCEPRKQMAAGCAATCFDTPRVGTAAAMGWAVGTSCLLA